MARRLRWAPRARQNLVEACRYISRTNPDAAKALAADVSRLAEEITELPFSGRIVPEYRSENIRERLCKSYRLVYRLQDDDLVEIVNIYHSAQRLPDSL